MKKCFLYLLFCLAVCMPVRLSALSAEDICSDLPGYWANPDTLKLESHREGCWWVMFNDASLDSLVSMADRGNMRLAGSLRRLQAAQMALKGVRAGYYPAVEASAGWNVMKNSGRTSAHYAETQRVDYFDAGLSMSWQIDVFGRISEQLKQGKAEVEVSRADYDGAMLTIRASVATAYFDYLAACERRQVIKTQLASQRRILDITMLRKETGLSSGLDVAQAETTVLSTEAALPAAEKARRNAINSLSLLIGCFPGRVEQLLALKDTALLPTLPEFLPIGIPADMVSARPDIQGARAQVDLYAARLGIARKEWMPQLTLTAAAGTQSSRFSDLFSSGSFYWEVAPKLSWTVFDGLSRKYDNAQAKLMLEAVVENYNETVLTAWSEVQNALDAYACSLDQLKSQELLLTQADKTFTLSLELYKQGLVDFTNVQNAQLSCLDARNSIIEARLQALTSLVSLYQALGLSGEMN